MLPFVPCVFCVGKRLRAARLRAANFALRRMGFATRESFDLHCAALRAAVGNGGGFDNDNKAGGFDNDDKGGGNDNHSAFADGGGAGCCRRLSAMAVAFLADGVNAVSREEFDAHCQILAAAEAKAKKAKAKSGKSPKSTKAATTNKEA